MVWAGAIPQDKKILKSYRESPMNIKGLAGFLRILGNAAGGAAAAG
jgi:hypothetical protein